MVVFKFYMSEMKVFSKIFQKKTCKAKEVKLLQRNVNLVSQVKFYFLSTKLKVFVTKKSATK